MPSISKDQQSYCKLAQLISILDRDWYIRSDLEKILLHDVNAKVLSNKSSNDCLIGATLLHIACLKKHSSALDILLKHGADFTATNNNGNTPLHQGFLDLLPDFAHNESIRKNIDNAMHIQTLLKAHVDSGNIKNPRSAQGLSHFHIACAFNDLEAVQLFLNGGVAINEVVNMDSSIFAGYTPLHFAVGFRAYETAKFLIERGADVNAKDTKGLTPLQLVIELNLKIIQRRRGCRDIEELNRYTSENGEIVKLFVENNQVLDVDNVGFSTFHAACTLDDALLAESFMKNIDVNSAIHMDSPICPGYTALHFAVQFNPDTVKLLLKNGASFEIEDVNGVTPFELYVATCGREDLYDILSAITGFKSIVFSDNKTKLSKFIAATQKYLSLKKFFKSTPKDVYLPKDCPIWPGYHLSHLSVLFAKSDRDDEFFSTRDTVCALETYLDCGGRTLIQDAQGRTSLHLAFYQSKTAATFLINFFFEREQRTFDAIDCNGLSHLHIACKTQSIEVVQSLLSKGANVNSIYRGKTLISRVNKGSTPLHIAVANGNIRIMKMLLEYGADANLVDAEGMTPMHRFTYYPPYVMPLFRREVKEIGSMLLSSCDVKNIICTNNGLSHLHFACSTGNVDAVERLLELGADPNAVFMCENNRELADGRMRWFPGYTPMHFALENNDEQIIQLLLQGGADILHKLPNGVTPLYDMVHFCYIHRPVTKIFTSMLANDMALRKRVEDDSGLTLLHTVCFLCDIEQIQSLLTESWIDVNAQMHVTSPIWPKATPLHLLIQSRHLTSYSIADSKDTLKMLLDSGADVTLMDNDGDTAIHKSWNNLGVKDGYVLDIVLLLLRGQTDFSVNPVNEEGVSYFHLACRLGQNTIVEKFLESGVDVNLPIDYLRKSMTFQTPLRFLLQPPILDANLDTESYLKTMDVLLKYGADVNVQDENGSTPLFEAFRLQPWRKLFSQKLYKAGADINHTNMLGQSILEIILNMPHLISRDELQILLDNPNLFNTFNSIFGVGIISMIIDQDPEYPNRKLIFETIMKIPTVFNIDSMGRTPIHNMVANPNKSITAVQYASHIERFTKMGFDIDAQDSTGKTALHLATKFRNEKAIAGLLIAGADINVTDMNNETAYTQQYKAKAHSHTILRYFTLHIMKLKLCGLELISENSKLADSLIVESGMQLHGETILKELEDAKSLKIGTGSLTLGNFLSETGAVASRPSMICVDRETVDEFFESNDFKHFPELRYLFKLQYRKMLKRLSLMKDATDSLREIIGDVNGFTMPEICCRMILRFLTNTEVKHLILSASIDKISLSIE